MRFTIYITLILIVEILLSLKNNIFQSKIFLIIENEGNMVEKDLCQYYTKNELLITIQFKRYSSFPVSQ